MVCSNTQANVHPRSCGVRTNVAPAWSGVFWPTTWGTSATNGQSTASSVAESLFKRHYRYDSHEICKLCIRCASLKCHEYQELWFSNIWFMQWYIFLTCIFEIHFCIIKKKYLAKRNLQIILSMHLLSKIWDTKVTIYMYEDMIYVCILIDI